MLVFELGKAAALLQNIESGTAKSASARPCIIPANADSS